MPVRTGSVHAHILTKPSRACFAVIRLELIEPGAETCVYQAMAWSPTDHLVRKFEDGLGINMTMKNFLIYVPVQQYKPEVGSPPRSARSGGHDPCQAAHTAATST